MQDEQDLRDIIFKNVFHTSLVARIRAEDRGVLCGIQEARAMAEHLGLEVTTGFADGATVRPGDVILTVKGNPKQIMMAEERLMGLMSKPSGIASSARRFIEKAGQEIRIVAGAWKKVRPDLKHAFRQAAQAGGAAPRMTDELFVYLDKNYTRVFGGIAQTLEALSHMKDFLKVIQVRGLFHPIGREAEEGALNGAGILFVDTGNTEDVIRVSALLREKGLRKNVQIAFGGGITLKDMDGLMALDIDILDIGRAIVDAPLLDMRMDIVPVE